MMIEGKCVGNIVWIMCACLFGMAFSVAEAADRPPEITLSVPKSIEEGMPVPVQVTIRNTSSKKICVLDEANFWRYSLRWHPRLFKVSKLGEKTSESLPVRKHDANGHMRSGVQAYLAPGKTATFNYQLRRMFAFPDKESGKYEVAFTWLGVIGKAQFSISKRTAKWKLIGRHELPLGISEFYSRSLDGMRPRTKEANKARVEVFVSPKGDKQRVIARTTYPLDPGAIVLSEQVSSVKRIKCAVIGGGPRTSARKAYAAADKVREMTREYLAVAWVESGNLMYTTFGCILYGPNIMREIVPKELRSVPAFSILCPSKVMKKEVKSIVHVKMALDDLVEIKVAMKDGTAATLYVNAEGKVVKPPSTQPRVKKPAIPDKTE